jgi:putative PIN family toxin of toxin-antitoxin system
MGPRVVVDTNVLVSALGWGGAPRQIVNLCLRDEIQVVLSPPILQGLERVLRYPKFSFPEETVVGYLEMLTEIAYLVVLEFHLQVVAEDPSDDRVLECALAGRVEFIVSGDRHLKSLGSFGGIKILAPATFLTELEA